jgi:hypothetical protein
MTEQKPPTSSLEGVTLDDIFQRQDLAATQNIADSETVQRRLQFVRDATLVAAAALSALPFEDEKQHAIRTLSMDAWSNLIVSVRVGLWGDAPESFALLRCGVETAAILAAAVEQRRYRTAVSEFAARQRQLSFTQAVDALGDAGKRIVRLHGDLSNFGSHATGDRVRFACYTHGGERYDRFAYAIDPEASALALRYALDLSLHLLTVLETAYVQDSKAVPWATDLDRLRTEFGKAITL